MSIQESVQDLKYKISLLEASLRALLSDGKVLGSMTDLASNRAYEALAYPKYHRPKR